MTALLPAQLPPQLWPHNFYTFSVYMAVILGVFNVLTLPLTIPAVFISAIVSMMNNLEV